MDKLFSIIWIDINTKDKEMYGCSGLFKTRKGADDFLEKEYQDRLKTDTCIGNINLENGVLRIEYESEYYDVLEYKIEEVRIAGDE